MLLTASQVAACERHLQQLHYAQLQRAQHMQHVQDMQLARAQSAREEAWLRSQWIRHGVEASRTVELLRASLQRMAAFPATTNA